MGQKVNPYAFRLGNQFTWTSRWFAKGDRYKKLLQEDLLIRSFLMQRLKNAGIARVEIDRSFDKRIVTVTVSRPGIVIGRGGTGMDELKRALADKLHLADSGKLEVKVEEVRQPDLDAYLVASSIADQLARRLPFRRVMLQGAERVMRSGAKGVKIALAGRLGGREIARREQTKQGSIPLSTLRANIDFAKVDARTKAGTIGVKVWIYKGEI